jgi:ribosomal protein S18 acetylase RimI-like enzyme
MGEIIDRYKMNGDKQITLHVNATNPAQKLYFDHGFRVVAVDKGYFGKEDGLLMKRVL